MQINLSDKIEDHLERLEDLSKEAAKDTEGTFSSRAAAMSALSKILGDVTKTRAEVINMERLMRIEHVTIEILKEFLTQAQHEDFLKRLEEVLGDGK